MLDYLLEEPDDGFKTSVWNKEWLMKEYQKEVVTPIIHQGWAIDEMECGIALEKIEEEIWQGYEAWAEKYFRDAQIEKFY